MLAKINYSKVILLVLFVLISSGFAIIGPLRWRITSDDPTLWIKACDDMKSHTWQNNNLDRASDSIGNITSPTYSEIIDSIIDDYNDIQSSYIRLAKYPDDPNNPGSPETGDSTFTTSKGSIRTIDVCFTDPGGILAGGDALQKTEGKEVVGCRIRIKKDYKTDLRQFTSTLTHELGHCLGLDHPMDTVNAIMSYFHSEKEFRLLLDDKMGMIFLYPTDASKAKESNSLGLSCSKR